MVVKSLARFFIFAGALSGALVVALGAYSAHAHIASEQSELLRTVIQYHMFHSLGLIVVGITAEIRKPSILVNIAGALMLFGTLFFCGTLYVFALSGYRGANLLAPIGGTALIASWFFFAFAVIRRS